MADIIDAAPTVIIIRFFDESAANVRSLAAGPLSGFRVFVKGGAIPDVVPTAARDPVGDFHETVDGFVDCFDVVGVVACELRVIRRLDERVDDAVDDAQCVHAELDALLLAARDESVLRIEVVVESWAVVAAVGFGPEVEG